MREFQLMLMGIVAGLLIMIGLNPTQYYQRNPDNRISSRTAFGNTHPVDEKFGGGIKINEDGGGETEVNPGGQGGN